MSTPLPAPLLFDLALVAFVLPVAIALLAWRAVRRRERRDARRRVRGLVRQVRAWRDDRRAGPALAGALSQAPVHEFWGTLERLRLTRGQHARLGRLLDRTRHVAAERRALLHESPFRRELAARRLGVVPGPRSRRALRSAVGAAPEVVAYAAARALARAGDVIVLEWLVATPGRLPHRTAREWSRLLLAFGGRASTQLAIALEHGIDDARLLRAAIEVLGLRRHVTAAPLIEQRLRHADADVRVAAARALGRLEATPCSDALLVALGDPEWAVRALAAWALGRVRRPEAVPALAGCLTDREWWVRRHAAYALAGLGDRGHAALRDAADHSPDRYARDMADEALRLAATAAAPLAANGRRSAA